MSKATSGDQPSGNSAGSPCAESGVNDSGAGAASAAAAIVSVTFCAESVPPSMPIVVAGAIVVSRASTTAVPTPF